MIPMRDGVKLHTVILRPRDQKGPLPILFGRTPYGASNQPPRSIPKNWAALAADGYIFVNQDMRGRFGSEGGQFTLSTAVHPGDRKATDESTDAYDSIDWLVKHVNPTTARSGCGESPIPASPRRWRWSGRIRRSRRSARRRRGSTTG
ncbi:MAG: CocE/NonD family hydrolase [Sphingomonas sp.]